MKKKVTNQMRREILMRGRLAMQGQKKWERSLIEKRDQAVKEALNAIKGSATGQMADIVEKTFNEPYMPSYYNSLYKDVSTRVGSSSLNTFKQLAGVKSDPNWENEVIDYIQTYTGARIVSVSGTLRAELVGWVQDALLAAPEMGVEKITQYVSENVLMRWNSVKEWQIRRIVQTESMAALGVGQDVAVRSLGIEYTKTWTATFNNTRAQHRAMDGTTVLQDEVFTLPNGDKMMFPSDYSMGASAENLINCSCGVYNIPRNGKF